jgi:uncharacterized membrane protein YdjX (TVP38/TMEM64 family)
MIFPANALPLAGRWMDFLQWLRGAGPAGGLIYGVVYTIAATLFFPALPLTLGAGLLYGTVVGTLIVSPASVAASALAFLIARYLARDWVARRLQKYEQAAAIDRAIEKNGFKVVLLLRLHPALPYNMLNYALGLTRIRLRDYVIASWIGMLPATVLYVYLGSIMHDVSDLLHGRLPNSGAAGRILLWGGLVATLALVWGLGRIAKKALQEELEQHPGPGEVV